MYVDRIPACIAGGYLPGGVPARGGYLPRYPPVNRMTDRCKNITLPQTLFAGGNYGKRNQSKYFLCKNLHYITINLIIWGWTLNSYLAS